MAVERPPGGGQWTPTPPPRPAPPPTRYAPPPSNTSLFRPPASVGGGAAAQSAYGGGAGNAAIASDPSQLGAFLAAIRQHESGGNYQEHGGIGGAAGATGAYQFMQGTWDGYAREMGRADLVGRAPWQASPADQDAVAGFMASQAFKRYGTWQAAAEVWYYPAWAGDPSKQNMVPVPGAGNTETIGAYGAQIVSMMGGAGGSAGGAGSYTASSTGALGGDVQAYIMRTDPTLDWALGIPEIANILSTASSQNYNDAQLTAALEGTDYYRAHSAQVRAWQALSKSDPATAGRDLQAAEATIRADALNLGITLTDSAIAGLAMGDEMFQWNPDEIRAHLLSASAFSQSGTLGAVGDGAMQARQLFAEYGIKLNDATAQQYGMQINTASSLSQALESLRPTAIAQAIGLFPSLAPLLEKGVTVANIFSPYQQQAATLLEKDPSQIDLTDPKFSRALQGDQKQGQMSQNQWQSTLMTDPQYHWDTTGNAKAAAVNLTTQLGNAFGVHA
jgi:hypothetical protein